MLTRGAISLQEKLQAFQEIYFDFRLQVFKEAYPQYQADPKKVEPGLRCDLKHFLLKLEELEQEIETNAQQEQPLEVVNSVRSFTTQFSAWMRNKENAIYLDLPSIEADQEDDEAIFKMDM